MKAAQLPPVLPQTWIPSGTDPRSWATPTEKRYWPPRPLGVSAAGGVSTLCSACGLAISGLLRQGLTTDFRRASMREIAPRSSD